MSRYYCLIAGLPDITLEDTKLAYSVADFKLELAPVLTDRDQQIMYWYYLKYDNRNILSFLKNITSEDNLLDSRGNFSKAEIVEAYNLTKKKERIPKTSKIPAYISKFIQAYVTRLENEESIKFHVLEDQLASFYFEEAMTCGNVFLSAWFEMNLNIGNLLAAFNCRKYGLDKEHFIIGDNEIAKHLRHTRARDFHFGDSIEYMRELLQVIEEKEPIIREKRLDVLRWKWIDEQTFFTTFDIENVLAYMLRLEMIERWFMLDKVRGGVTFRQLVSDMKRESAKTLEEFKENNK